MGGGEHIPSYHGVWEWVGFGTSVLWLDENDLLAGVTTSCDNGHTATFMTAPFR